MFQTYPRHQKLWHSILNQLDDLDLAHDHLHIQRVYQWAIAIAKDIQESPDLAGAAALLHDLINIPKESSQRSEGSTLSAIAGVEHLEVAEYNKEEITIITDAIRTCSWSKGLAPINNIGKVLQDADRLDAIGAIGIMRNMACAQAMSTRQQRGHFYHRDDPFHQSERTLDDKEYAIDHFYKKLLLIADGFHSSLAQKEGQRRHQFMLLFLEELQNELILAET